MPNSPSKANLRTTLAAWLAEPYGDGTIADAVNVAKVNGTPRNVSEIPQYVAAQYGDIVDDFVIAAQEWFSTSAKLVTAADLPTLEGFGTDTSPSVAVGDGAIAGLGVYSCATVAATSSTWTLVADIGGGGGGGPVQNDDVRDVNVTDGGALVGTDGAYPATQASTSGSGTGATFDVELDSGAIVYARQTAPGSGYAIGDTITLSVTGPSQILPCVVRVQGQSVTDEGSGMWQMISVGEVDSQRWFDILDVPDADIRITMRATAWTFAASMAMRWSQDNGRTFEDATTAYSYSANSTVLGFTSFNGPAGGAGVSLIFGIPPASGHWDGTNPENVIEYDCTILNPRGSGMSMCEWDESAMNVAGDVNTLRVRGTYNGSGFTRDVDIQAVRIMHSAFSVPTLFTTAEYTVYKRRAAA